MMPGGGTENMIGNNRTMANIKQEIENPTTPTQNYQVCSPTTTLQHQEVFWTCTFYGQKEKKKKNIVIRESCARKCKIT